MIDIANFNLLRRYEDILIKYDFNKTSPSYIDPLVKKELATIYQNITGSTACGSCNNDWIKRLSLWYFETMENYG